MSTNIVGQVGDKFFELAAEPNTSLRLVKHNAESECWRVGLSLNVSLTHA